MICPHCGETTNYVRGSRDVQAIEYFTLNSDGEEEHDEYGNHGYTGQGSWYTCPDCDAELTPSEIEDMLNIGGAPVAQVTPVKDAWKGLV
jgi:hypothetical protein